MRLLYSMAPTLPGPLTRQRRTCVTWALLLLSLFRGALTIARFAAHLRFLLVAPPVAIGFALFLVPCSRRAH